jgi:hypothetical protein
MKLLHTPGPWEAFTHGDISLIFAPNNRFQNGGKGDDLIAMPPPFRAWKSREKWAANAKLIAAAPDLLQALMDILPHAENIINSKHAHYIAAIAAIDKATK